ncbi:hypothetical protein LWH94_09385 [Marinobacter sp. G11]|uniref:hypothetical protein n=1 Tax=Marinobacter sp. G11 TaxID=2903522 RepID=UPI001E649C43|nr:hypothetical protein [Marinobacter sp. G11]MCE0759416.1 hypothetical protein [Marinobacter sp. G11]
MTEEIYGEAMKFFSDRQQDPGKRTGLNVQFTATRKKYPTLSVEVAPILEPGQSPYWARKITIQLTPTELTAFCGVMFGLRKSMKGAYHGEAKNKGIAAYNNGPSGAVIALSEQGRQLQNFLTPEDRLELAVFSTRRLAEAWKVTPSDAVAFLRQAAWLDRQPS